MPKPKQKKKGQLSIPPRALRKDSPVPRSAHRLTGKNLEQAVEQFQSEPDDRKAHDQWKQIESSVFGVEFED
jgi:hypothetical protein